MDFFFKCFARKVLGDMARTREALHTERRTDGHIRREEQYVSRKGRHIIITSLNIDAVYPVDGTMFILNGLYDVCFAKKDNRLIINLLYHTIN